MMGSVSMAERLAGKDRRLKRHLDAIRQAAERGELLTRQLLAFSRRQPLQPQIVDVPSRLRDLTALLNRSLRGDIEIVTRVPTGLRPIVVGPGEREPPLLPHGPNAREAISQGGPTRLRPH